MKAPAHWYVTAAHVVHVHDEEYPYGTQHARQPGSALTACGLFALNWPILWSRPFWSTDEDTCEACADFVHQWDRPPLSFVGDVCEDCVRGRSHDAATPA